MAVRSLQQRRELWWTCFAPPGVRSQFALRLCRFRSRSRCSGSVPEFGRLRRTRESGGRVSVFPLCRGRRGRSSSSIDSAEAAPGLPAPEVRVRLPDAGDPRWSPAVRVGAAGSRRGGRRGRRRRGGRKRRRQQREQQQQREQRQRGEAARAKRSRENRIPACFLWRLGLTVRPRPRAVARGGERSLRGFGPLARPFVLSPRRGRRSRLAFGLLCCQGSPGRGGSVSDSEGRGLAVRRAGSGLLGRVQMKRKQCKKKKSNVSFCITFFFP